ncbi:YfhO family protein [Weissella sagaensis]|uniref:YfhO family protein n=1 Tax=Weissella sagaensis TaxID=2559928 RepID=UPI00123B1718|nr:YfhO family protein [Weissella sagaensis]KAA8432011.1 YfhO family protein [Weissella paramesenteroides]KAA8436774.1 YfhO family protein [Weissella paramesenteroides]UEG66790.1 YfhO family protein [Weissella hellenica]
MGINAIKKGIYYLIPALFFVMLLAYVGRFGFLYSGADLQFHANRIFEYYNHLKSGNLIPVISTFSSNQIGSLVPTMYPSLPIYIGAILQFIFPPVTSLYVLMWAQLMVQFSIAKWVGKELSLSVLESTIAAFIYTITTPLISQSVQQWLFGEVWAMSFMPLVVLGLIRLVKSTTDNIVKLDRKTILLLAIGFTLIILSHMLSFVIITVYTAIFTAFLLIFKKNKLNSLANLSVSAIVTILLSMVFLMPFIIAMLRNDLATPGATTLTIWSAPDIQELFKTAFSFKSDVIFKTNSIGIVAFISIFGVLFTWWKQDRFTKYATIVSMLIIFSGMSYIWQYLYTTPLGVIQFPHRVFIIAIFLLSLTSIFMIRNIFQSIKVQRILYVGLTIISVVVTLFSLKFGFVDRVNALSVRTDYKPTSKKPVSYTPIANFKIKNDDFKNIMGYWITYGAFDYMPANFQFNKALQEKKIIQNGQLINTSTKSISNGLIYQAKFKKQVQTILPMVGYQGLNYEIVDNHHQHYDYKINKDKQLVIKTRNVAINKVTVRAITPITTYIAWIISMVTFLLLLVSVLRNKNK